MLKNDAIYLIKNCAGIFIEEKFGKKKASVYI
jgi:hypothetical protein